MSKYHQNVIERWKKLIVKLDEYNSANKTNYNTIESRAINEDLDYKQIYTYIGDAKQVYRNKFAFTAFVLLIETPDIPDLHPGHKPGIEEIEREPYIKTEIALEDETTDNIRMYKGGGNYGSRKIDWITKIKSQPIENKPVQLNLF
ncbi:MAG: hypothetical protein KME10_00595 [Plectolyngbya sp. WJT66-NPBG17]|jgi:hypothetical protein|nr:hypothetical protein [Plectolyngbya sp. WJT66-NPBG17]MBW4523678.1 hypothetical protein [Phormidium tanganyikae FI6-MK23]